MGLRQNIKEDGSALRSRFSAVFRRSFFVSTPVFAVAFATFFLQQPSFDAVTTILSMVMSLLGAVVAAAFLAVLLGTLGSVHYLAGLWVLVPIIAGSSFAALLLYWASRSEAFYGSWFLDMPRGGGGHGGGLVALVVLLPLLLEFIVKFAMVALAGFGLGALLSVPLTLFGIGRRTHRRYASRKQDASLPPAEPSQGPGDEPKPKVRGPDR